MDKGIPEEIREDLKEIKKAFEWTWNNMANPHTADQFNIPANGIELLDKLIGYGLATPSKNATPEEIKHKIEIKSCMDEHPVSHEKGAYYALSLIASKESGRELEELKYENERLKIKIGELIRNDWA